MNKYILMLLIIFLYGCTSPQPYKDTTKNYNIKILTQQEIKKNNINKLLSTFLKNNSHYSYIYFNTINPTVLFNKIFPNIKKYANIKMVKLFY